MSLQNVIAKLDAWREEDADFHADRQLADEILIADGWSVHQDSTWEGGIRWSWGTSPQVSVSERTRPHPINDMNAAIGVVPFRHGWRLEVNDGECIAYVWPLRPDAEEHRGDGPTPQVALLIAALRAKSAAA